jgi:predicted permease
MGRPTPAEPSRIWVAWLRLIVTILLPASRRGEAMGDLQELWVHRRALGRRDLRRASLGDLAGLIRVARWRRGLTEGQDMWQDVRYAVRTWTARPTAAAAIVMTLALGIGASAAIFSAVDALLLRPLPFPAPDQLVHVENPSIRFGRQPMVPPSFVELPEIAAAGVWQPGGANLELGLTSHRVAAAIVDDGFFATMGVPAAIGDVLPASNTASRMVVVSHEVWRTRLGGDRTIIGRPITINGQPYTLTGVMPPTFTFPGVDIWLPPNTDFQVTGDVFAPNVVARIAAGVPVPQAAAAVEAYQVHRWMAAGQEAPTPDDLMTLQPLAQQLTSASRPTLVLLAASVALLLLVVCASVANILLAKVASRHRDLQVRRALGASRGRLVRQAAIEGLLLAGTGGLAGVAIAAWSLSLLRALAPATLGDGGISGLDLRVLAIALFVVVATAVMLSVGPAIAVSAGPSADVVRGGRGDTGGRGWRRVRSALIVGQMAMALVLLSAGAAAVTTLMHVSSIDLGFGGTQAVTAQVTLPLARFGKYEAAVDYIDRARARVAAAPGVVRVAAAGTLPGYSGFGGAFRISVPSRPASAAPSVSATMLTASPDYFSVMGIRVIAGRGVAESDRRGSPPVVVLSAGATRRLFTDPAAAVGSHVEIGLPPNPMLHEVIGVVSDVYLRGADADAATLSQMYFPAAQRPPFGVVSFVAEVRGQANGGITAVRDALADVDGAVPVYGLQTLDSVSDRYLSTHRLTGALISAFAIVTLIVAAVGLFGVMAQVVAERRREIGIRLALGASAREVRRRLIGHAVALAAAGAVIGAGAAAGALRALGSLVPSLQEISSGTVAMQTVVLLLTAVAAAWGPASRVLSIDPALVLRDIED